MRDWENNIRKVVPYTPGEQPKNTCVIKLNTNENPYPPAPGVKEVLSNFNTDDLRLYPDPRVDKLVNAIADFYKIDSSKVFVGVGSDDVLAMIFMTFFNSKMPILLPDITYSFYDVWADMLRIPYEQLPLSDDFSIVPSDYYKANGGVVFPNPNAPTGKLMPLDEIEDIIEHNQDVIVVVDEAYVDFGGESALPLIDKYLNDVKYSFNSYTMDRITIEAATAAVKDRAYFEETTAKVIKTREWTKKELKRLGFTFCDSKSNFIFAKPANVSATKLFEDLKADNIFVRHFSSPERINDYLRISIGTDEQMHTLIKFLENYSC